MENWAVYMRGQADALGLDSIDTSRAPISFSLAGLRRIVESLREQRRRAIGGRLVIVCGLPGSGKSMYVERSGGTALSSDELRRLLSDDPANQNIHRLVFSVLRSLLGTAPSSPSTFHAPKFR